MSNMRERERFNLAKMTAETMYTLWELDHQRNGRDMDGMMRRLKDLSAYSLTRAEILEQREGVELLALAMFFGATSDLGFHKNQERLKLLSEETIAYPGRAEIVEEQVARRQVTRPARGNENNGQPQQRRLL